MIITLIHLTLREQKAKERVINSFKEKQRRRNIAKKASAKLVSQGEVRFINGRKTLILPCTESKFVPKKKNRNAKLIKAHKKRL